ncbi:DUF7768 domain-containing protein [Caproiciproducens sp. LBM24188]
MKLVYICSPLHGDMEKNIEMANQYCASAARMDVVPLAPHTIFTKYLNDNVPQQRERALAMGLALLSRCDELWVCGNVISPGMRGEIEYAKTHGIPIKHMKEVLELNMKPDLKKLHTQKSMILQQYQPIYTAYYTVTVDKNLGNFAQVLFDNGNKVTVDGAKHALDFLKMESGELQKAVADILKPLILSEWNKLFQQLGLEKYSQLFPMKDTALPYLVIDQNDLVTFTYCPVAKHDKFALLILNDFGRPFFDIDNRFSGTYSDELRELPFQDARLDVQNSLNLLKEIEPVAFQEYQEHIVMQKLDRVFQETGARMFVFSGGDSNTPAIVNIPEEANDYLTPEELALAEEVVLRQESDNNQPDLEIFEPEEEQELCM